MYIEDRVTLSEEQLDIRDLGALHKAKKSLVVIAKSFNIPLTSIPKPCRSVLESYLSYLNNLDTRNGSANIETITFLAAFLTHYECGIPLEQTLSCFAYVLAINGFLVGSIDNVLSDCEKAVSKVNTIGSDAYVLGAEVEVFCRANITLMSIDKIAPTVLNKDAVEDPAVQSRCKTNYINILACYGSNVKERKPCHTDLSGDWSTLMDNYAAKGVDVLNGHAEYLLLLWIYSTLSLYEKLDPKVMPLEYLDKAYRVAYYFAALGYVINRNGVTFSESDMYCLSDTVHGTYDINIEALQRAVTQTALMRLTLEKRESENTEQIPVSLLRYLDNMRNIECIINEICKLQKLSPSSMLVSDPKKAMINAWLTLNK